MESMTWMLRRRWWLLPVLAILVAGSIAVNLGSGETFHPLRELAGAAAAVVLATLAAAGLLAIDRWPAAAMVGVGALVGGYFAVGGENGPILFAVVVAAFLVATREPVREWFGWLVVAAVLVWAGLVIRAVRWEEPDLAAWQAIGLGLLVSAAASIGTTDRTLRETASLERRRAATEEQLRMAQDLHDGVGHGLALIAMQAGVALHVLEKDPAGVRTALEAIRDTSRESLAALRTEVAQLTGEAAYRAPLRGLSDLGALVDRVRATGLEVIVTGSEVDVDAPRAELPGDVETTAYAVVQEALTNVMRHADGAQTVRVDLSGAAGALVVSVTDDGRGLLGHDEGMGLRGMRDRVTALGGTLETGPNRDGFRVRAVLRAAPR
ncbi:signal transduction histidine kinase [Nocardioides daedukensis]|uniref:histidine kinase n=1 Tax=Nocardioides daedukensis TaxID=634462 RepID=A0A7Y9RY23_9ACTN|nr:sensor histidine kinase [Nocardioides daedukensis]NYG58776.1 signal transduction histidine kinase [Nocardioides daedukensis]